MTYPEEVAFQEGWLAAIQYLKEVSASREEYIEQMLNIYADEMAHLDQAKRELDTLSIEVYQKSRLSGITYPVTAK